MTARQIARQVDREATRRFLYSRVAARAPLVLPQLAFVAAVLALLAWGIVTVCNDIANGAVW